MSVEEDTELRDLVSQTLENNGVLAKIRAELRASVFLAVEEQESHLSKTPFVNNALKEYLSTPHGALGLCLVKEFLEYLELDFTISVFNSETRIGKDYEYEGRSKLLMDLQVKNINGKKGPLLAHILHIAQQCSEAHSVLSDVKEEAIGSLKKKPEIFASGDESNLSANFLQNHKDHVDSPNVSLSPLDRTYTTDSSSAKGVSNLMDSTIPVEEEKSKQVTLHSHPLQSSSEAQQRLSVHSDSSMKYISGNINFISDVKSEKAPLKDLAKGSERNSCPDGGGGTSEKNRRPNAEKTMARKSQETSSPMTSLNNLPPLDGIQTKRDPKVNNSNILIDDLDPQVNYEEDFQSTESSAVIEENSKSRSHHSSNKPTKGGKESLPVQRSQDTSEKSISDKGTETPSICEEIDQDTNSEVDDLLNSTTSGENTMEATLSHLTSNLADYCEDL